MMPREIRRSETVDVRFLSRIYENVFMDMIDAAERRC
jgi:hypothetical protein